MLEQLVGQVLRQIRTAEGDSLRDAEARCGINRCLLNRLENGRAVRNLRELVAKFAVAYHRRADLLLEGLDSRGTFSTLVANAVPQQRAKWMQMSPSQRTALTVEFFLTHGGPVVTAEKLAQESDTTVEQLKKLRSQWRRGHDDPGLSRRIAQALSALTGIDMAWFTCGLFEGEAAADGIAPDLEFFAAKTAGSAKGQLPPRARLAPLQRIRQLLEPTAS